MRARQPMQEHLDVLDEVSRVLGAGADAATTLQRALAALVDRMQLEAGWIVVVDPNDKTPTAGMGFTLAAHCRLSSELAVERPEVWDLTCRCEQLCQSDRHNDAYNETACPRLAALSQEYGRPLAHASVPLSWRGRTVGILNLACADWKPFDESSLDLFMRAGRLLGAALGRAKLYETVQHQRGEEHAALLGLSAELLSGGSLPVVMEAMVETVRRIVASDACAVLIPDSHCDRLLFGASTGWRSAPDRSGRSVRCDEHCSAWIAMCAGQPLAIEDLEESEVGGWTSEWMRGEGFRAQAVIPLVARDDPVGALVVHSRRPRAWSPEKLQFLHLMANQAALAIQAAALREGVRSGRGVELDLAIAKKIQSDMLPHALPQEPGWEFETSYATARSVGGDVYDFLRWPETPTKLGILIGDAAGKGVTGALLMAQGLESLRGLAVAGRGPAAVLERANARLRWMLESGHFMTCFYAVLDLRDGRLTYACAGHEPGLLWRARTGALEELQAPGAALGLLADPHLGEREARLEPGDRLVLHTDGVCDALDAQRRRFGGSRFRTAVRSAARQGSVVETVVRALRRHRGDAEPFDDATLLEVHRLP